LSINKKAQVCDASPNEFILAGNKRKIELMKLANKILLVLLFAGYSFLLGSSCKVYSFKDVSIPPNVKTVKIGFIENKARYVNPQLSPRLTDRLQQKVSSQTKLSRTNSEDAHYQINGYISGYDVTTAAISGQREATNRLTVTVHIVFRNTLDNKTEEYDVNRSFDFPASLSLPQAEANLLDEIVRNMTDEIFNRIFSNW
jgi:hypothetical protein